ncbi:hypothetical protein ACIQVR_19625 [Streptomyces xanthochromogenes]|uniref:hypothetical protein n=1 Tax=Streptomyces xanthochromogenes TaxID=67384 RepID=UPI003809D6D1
MTPGEPQSPVLLFEEDGHMSVIPDVALAAEIIEDETDFYEGFDGLARPVRPIGLPGKVELVLLSQQPEEAAVRCRVNRYYTCHASRHPTRSPPSAAHAAGFVSAVANDEVSE